MTDTFYTYIHCRPNGEPFYVGKGYRNRAYDFNSNRNPHYKRTVLKYGKNSISVYIFECESEELALLDEIQQISQLRKEGFNLVNVTDGGEGVSGLRHSDETKRKISESKKGVSITSKGRPLSTSHRVKLSMAKKGKPSPRKGKPHSAESKLKMSAAMIGIVLSEETRKKMSEYRMGKKQDLTQCPHCKKLGGDRNMKRYHFKNCRLLNNDRSYT